MAASSHNRNKTYIYFLLSKYVNFDRKIVSDMFLRGIVLKCLSSRNMYEVGF